MESIWSQTCEIKPRDSLKGNVETEVAVIGAGMAGILIASKLQEKGHKVIVLEADRIAGGQTKNTTAKITSQHGIIYSKLLSTFGKEKAKQYAMANEMAIREYRSIISERCIKCDLEEKRAYVYGNDEAGLKKEAEAAESLDLPARYENNIRLPFWTVGAVCFDDQAQFNPLKFIDAVAEDLTVYEHTSVMTVEDGIMTTNNGIVHADKIVFACHYPFINFPGMYFARMHQERSYVLALKDAGYVDGMYVGADEESYSFRMYGSLLLLGGGGHRTGENSKGGRYEKLRYQAKLWFPKSREVTCWSAQDCIPPDNVPYIGRYAESRPNFYVATGFQKWGMTSSMVSAMIISDMIDGRDNEYSGVFDPGRFDIEAIPKIAAEGGQSVKGLSRRVFQIPQERVSSLQPGNGGIVLYKGDKVGVYKDMEGKVYAVDVKCPHLGCQLEWNPDELSWDCPCHGSRFDFMGNLISGPAQESVCRE